MSPLDPGTMCEYGSAQIVGHVQERDFASEKAILKGLISGRGPTGVAAAAYYSAGNVSERRTQKEVADVAGVTSDNRTAAS